MTLQEIKSIATLWISCEGDGPAHDQLYDLCVDDPENAWLVVQEILTHELSEDTGAVLAAGPIEDLLSKHGTHFIDRIEAKARSDSKFNHLLGGIWKSSIQSEVWQRLEKVRNTVW